MIAQSLRARGAKATLDPSCNSNKRRSIVPSPMRANESQRALDMRFTIPKETLNSVRLKSDGMPRVERSLPPLPLRPQVKVAAPATCAGGAAASAAPPDDAHYILLAGAYCSLLLLAASFVSVLCSTAFFPDIQAVRGDVSYAASNACASCFIGGVAYYFLLKGMSRSEVRRAASSVEACCILFLTLDHAASTPFCFASIALLGRVSREEETLTPPRMAQLFAAFSGLLLGIAWLCTRHPRGATCARSINVVTCLGSATTSVLAYYYATRNTPWMHVGASALTLHITGFGLLMQLIVCAVVLACSAQAAQLRLCLLLVIVVSDSIVRPLISYSVTAHLLDR